MTDKTPISSAVSDGAPFKIISLGYRCSAGGIIQRLGLKHESFPFDWLVSRLSVVQHCIETNFEYFLDISNYKKQNTITFEHFESSSPEEIVCHENIIANTFYQPNENPDPVSTYHYHLAMNHHNIIDNPADFEYYKRCVNRFQTTFCDSSLEKVVVHITPLYTMKYYSEHSGELIEECAGFHRFLRGKFSNVKGLYFIMVKDIENKPSYIQYDDFMENPDDPGSFPTQKICVIFANNGFIDAGGTFMGEFHQEELLIKNIILRFVKNPAEPMEPMDF